MIVGIIRRVKQIGAVDDRKGSRKGHTLNAPG
jgi:hypothetical protein